MNRSSPFDSARHFITVNRGQFAPPVANLLGRYGNGVCRHQALRPEIGHDPLAFGAEQLPFQPGKLLGEQGNLRALLLDAPSPQKSVS